MKLFDKLYDLSAAGKKALKKPLVKNKINRAFAGALDGLDGELLDLDEKKTELQIALAGGETEKLRELIALEVDRALLIEQKAAAIKLQSEFETAVPEETPTEV